MTKPTAERKPCPWCGRKPTFEARSIRAPWVLSCPNWDCPAMPDVSGVTKRETIAKWNERSKP